MAKINVKTIAFIGFLILAAVILVTVVVSLWVKPGLDIDPRVGRVFEPPRTMPRFSLIDQKGKPFDNSRLANHWNIAMIGFTYCPDVCPTTVSNVAAFFNRLGDQSGGEKIPRFIFFSVDPFRDTPDVLSNYVEYYNEDFIGVTGEPQDILDLVKALGLFYAYTDPKDNHMLDDVLMQPALEEYGVMHSTRLLFISPAGKLVASMAWPYTSASILAFYQKLQKYYGD